MSLPVRPNKTTAGIVVDPQTLERVVPSSRRTDGTTRKELKIRPGFTPQEDIGRFRSTRQQDSDATRNIVPGSAGRKGNKKDPYAREGEGDTNPFKSDPTPAEAAAGAKSKAQLKNEKRREKKRTGAGAGLHDDLKWDDDEPGGNDGGDGDGGKEMKEAFERMDRLRLNEAAGAAEPQTETGKDGGIPKLDPLGMGHTAPGGGAPAESVAAAVAAEHNAEADNDSPSTSAPTSVPAQGASTPSNGHDTRAHSPTDPITSPPPAPESPETAAQLVSSEKTEQAWKAARPPRQQRGGADRGGGGRGGRGAGRGGAGGRGGAPAAGHRSGQPQQQQQQQQPPEPRVRKEVRVREGTAGDSGSLAARVRGLLVGANQEPRSPRKTPAATGVNAGAAGASSEKA